MERKRGASLLTYLQNGIMFSSSAKEDFKCKIYTLGRSGDDIAVEYPVLPSSVVGGSCLYIKVGFCTLSRRPSCPHEFLQMDVQRNKLMVIYCRIVLLCTFSCCSAQTGFRFSLEKGSLQESPIAFFQDLEGDYKKDGTKLFCGA